MLADGSFPVGQHLREELSQRSQAADIFLQRESLIAVTRTDNQIEGLLEWFVPISLGCVHEVGCSHLCDFVSTLMLLKSQDP